MSQKHHLNNYSLSVQQALTGNNLQDFDASVAKWKAAGFQLTDEVRRPGRKAAYVFSPDGFRVEIAEVADNPPFAGSIVNDHIHFYLVESAGPEMLAWYAEMFGGEMGMRGANPARHRAGSAAAVFHFR